MPCHPEPVEESRRFDQREPMRSARANVTPCRDLSAPLKVTKETVIPSGAEGGVEESRGSDKREPTRVAPADVPPSRDVSAAGLPPLRST